MVHTPVVQFLPLPADLPLTANHLEFARHVSAHLDRWPLRFGPGETMRVQYLEALGYLVRSYAETHQATVWDTYTDQLPTGATLDAATPDELRVATVTLYGLARDRAQNRACNAGIEAWVQVAREALEENRLNPIYELRAPVVPVAVVA